jgi:hypothetical protein
MGRDDLICIVQKTLTIIKDYTASRQKHFLRPKKDKYRNTTNRALRFCFTRSGYERAATEDAQYQLRVLNTKRARGFAAASLRKMRRDQ